MSVLTQNVQNWTRIGLLLFETLWFNSQNNNNEISAHWFPVAVYHSGVFEDLGRKCQTTAYGIGCPTGE